MTTMIHLLLQVSSDFHEQIVALYHGTNPILLALAVILSCIFYPLGGVHTMILVLILFTLFDFLTGIRCAQVTGKLSSYRGKRGIEKKMYMYLVIIIANCIDKAFTLPYAPCRNVIIAMYIGFEGFSILENLDAMGVKTPNGLRTVFAYLIKKEQEWSKNLLDKDEQKEEDMKK